MKNLKAVIIVILFLIPAFVYGQSVGKIAYKMESESKLSFDGTSTLHDFTCNAGVINAELFAASEFMSFISNPDQESFNIKVTIPVKSISSGKDGMDERMMEAFKADKHSNITYVFKKASSKAAPELGEGFYTMETVGDLTIAGVTKPVDMTVTSYQDKAGKIRFKGSKKIKMTDFNIKPPTMMLGTIKTGNEITINFELVFRNEK